MLEYLHGQPQRRNRTALVLALLLLLLMLMWSARGALLPYVIALVLIYLLLPVVNWLDARLLRLVRRPGAARALAILIAYLAVAGLVAAFMALIVPVLTQQFRALWAMRGLMIARIQSLTQQSVAWYRESVPPEIQAQVDDYVSRIGATIGSAIQTGAFRTFNFLTSTVSTILGFAVVPFWMFYVLFDHKRITGFIHRLLPQRYQTDATNLWHLIDAVLSSYIRGQLLLCVIIGVLATLGLTLLGVPFPALLGLVAGLTEFLPFIGPILGAVPAVLVALIQSPILGLWTVLLYLGIQQVENLFLAPRISGGAVELHPAAIMVVLVVGNEVGGLLGMLIAVPLTAILRDVFRYLYMRFQDDPRLPAPASESQ